MSAMRIAITQGDISRTAVRLSAIANEIASVIATIGASGARLAITTADRGACLAAVVGAWRGGAVPVPLSEVAPRAASTDFERLRERIETAEPALVLCDEAHRAIMAGCGFRPLCEANLGSHQLWQAPRSPRLPSPPEAALIMFTSGSTGTAKGIVISPTVLDAIASTNRRVYQLGPNDCFLSTLPTTHMAGLTNLLAAEAGGTDVVVAPPMVFVSEVRALMRSRQVTVAGMVPHQLQQLFGTAAAAQLPRLRLIVSSGAQLSSAVAASTLRAQPGLSLVNAYGLTEAFRSFAAPIDVDDPSGIGNPVPGVQARLVDPTSGKQVAAGAIGEVELQGLNVFCGYWTAQGFRKSGREWFSTGDMATTKVDGTFRLVGRQTSFVNVGGHKEAVETIESVLEHAAPGRLAVAGAVDEHGLEHVVVVAETDTGVRLAELRRISARRLAPSLKPHRLVQVDQLPRTPIGKIDRRAVAEIAATNGSMNDQDPSTNQTPSTERRIQ